MRNKFISAIDPSYESFGKPFSFKFETCDQFFGHPYIIQLRKYHPEMNLYKTASTDGYEIIALFEDGTTKLIGFIKQDLSEIRTISNCSIQFLPKPQINRICMIL